MNLASGWPDVLTHGKGTRRNSFTARTKYARINVSIPRISSHHAYNNSQKTLHSAAGKTRMEVRRYVQHGKAKAIPVVHREDWTSEIGIWAEQTNVGAHKFDGH